MANTYLTRKMSHWTTILVLYVFIETSDQALLNTEFSTSLGAGENILYDFTSYKTNRLKRDVPLPPANVTNDQLPIQMSSSTVPTSVNVTDLNSTKTSPHTTANTTLMPNVTTQIPLLGVNGSGIRKDVASNQPKVSDPIQPDDTGFNMTTIFKETPELIKAEHNLTNIKYDNHTFYNSSFIGDPEHFNQYWTNITKAKADIHAILSYSHRRATTLKLTFDFPFYGHPLRSITVATGGFIYMGDHVHSWLAATQYVAPLMANFDTRLTNNSVVKLYDDGTKFTALWENVTLQENKTKTFTFAVTLMNNGDIVFAYKDIPIPIKDIGDKDHPVKVGISDAYLTDKILFYVRRKTIYEYHRVSFMNHEIKSGTIIKLISLPTCVQYDTCESCTNHQTAFNCSWCSQIQRCSSGIDRYKQDWTVRNCEKFQISNVTECPAASKKATDNHTTTYFIDNKTNPYHDTVVKTDVSVPKKVVDTLPDPTSHVIQPVAAGAKSQDETGTSPIGGVVAAFIAVVLISSGAAWALYAFKNPHTRSGQLLIKYRPSQWSWKRGEARYTAATIHM